MPKAGKFLVFAIFLLYAGNSYAVVDPFGVKDKLNGNVTLPECTNVDIAKEINLVDSIDIALCNNPNTRASWLNAKASAARLGEGKSAYLPTLTATGELVKTYNKNTVSGISNNGSTRNLSQNSTSYGPGLSLDYIVYDFGSRKYNTESLKQQMLQAAFNYNSTIQNTVFQVINAYLNVFTAHEDYESEVKSEAAAKEAFDAAKAKFEVGVVTKVDQAQAETAYAQSRLAREQAENDMKLVEGNFAVMLNLPPDQVLQLAAIDPLQANSALDHDIQQYIDEGLKNRPDLAAYLAQEKQAAADYKYSKTLYYPYLSVNGTTSKYDYINLDGSEQNNTIGLNLSFPLFTGFNNNYKKMEARNLLEAARANRQSAENSVKLDVWNTYHNFLTAQKKFTTAQTLLSSAQESEDLALGRYKVGKGTLNDTLDAQASLADARRQWVEARYNILITRFDLYRAIGSQSWQQDLKPVLVNSKIEADQQAQVQQPLPAGTVQVQNAPAVMPEDSAFNNSDQVAQQAKKIPASMIKAPVTDANTNSQNAVTQPVNDVQTQAVPTSQPAEDEPELVIPTTKINDLH